MHKLTLFISIFFAIIVIAFAAYFIQQDSSPAVTPTPAEELTGNIYNSDTYKVRFSYPDGYYLTEKETGSPQLPQHTIVLVEDTQENRDVIEGRSTEPREGPTAITIDIYQNFQQYNPEQWIQNSTNWTLSNQEIKRSRVQDRDALSYTWSGLYEGTSTVISHAPYIYVVSVTSLTPEDQILADYTSILNSLEFQN